MFAGSPQNKLQKTLGQALFGLSLGMGDVWLCVEGHWIFATVGSVWGHCYGIYIGLFEYFGAQGKYYDETLDPPSSRQVFTWRSSVYLRLLIENYPRGPIAKAEVVPKAAGSVICASLSRVSTMVPASGRLSRAWSLLLYKCQHKYQKDAKLATPHNLDHRTLTMVLGIYLLGPLLRNTDTGTQRDVTNSVEAC